MLPDDSESKHHAPRLGAVLDPVEIALQAAADRWRTTRDRDELASALREILADVDR